MSTSPADEIWAILREVAAAQKETERKIQEIWEQWRETDRKFQETDRQFKETDRQFKETDRQFKETDRKFQETDRQFKETDRKFQETDRKFEETARRFEETDRQFKETDRKFQETDRQFKETDRKIGKLTNRLGDFIEDAVRPAAVRLFRERDIDVHEVQQNVTVRRGEEGLEIDLLVVNDLDTVAVECKSNLSVDDVDEHLERLGKFKRLLPRYARSRVMGAVAAMVIPDNVAQYAHRKGLFVIGQNGDHLEIRNDTRFAPKVW